MPIDGGSGSMTYPASTFDRVAPIMERRSVNRSPVGFALAALVVGALYLNAAFSWRQATLFLVGCAAGVVLYHAAFGFTSAWRHFIAGGRGAGLRAQMLMLAVTCLVFVPALGSGHLLGQAVRGSVSPVGASVIAGSVLCGG